MDLSTPLMAAGLANIAMLGWLAAAAIPVLLHLINNRRQTRRPWAAMQLLRRVIDRESRRIRLEQLLLLVLRTLIPVVLAVVLARPYLRGPSAAAVDVPLPRLWIVAIDMSYSMGYRHERETRIAQAKSLASTLVEESSVGDSYALLALGASTQVVIGRPTFDKNAMLTEIDRLACLDTGMNLSNGLAAIEDIVTANTQAAKAAAPEIRIVLISDLGEDSWGDGSSSSPIQRQLAKLAQAHSLQVVPVTNEDTANLAITALRSSHARVTLDQPFELLLSIGNFSPTAQSEFPVQIQIDGQTVASQSLDIPANSTQSVSFSISLNRLGPTVLSAFIADDRLQVDNQRSIVVEVIEQYRILVVAEQIQQARFLEYGLRGNADATKSKVTVTSRTELPEVRFEDLHGIVLYNLPRIDASIYDRLLRFCRDGGSVVLMLGNDVVADDWNTLADDSNPLLGFRITEVADEDLWEIDPLEYASPIVSPFAGFADAGLLTTPIFRFWKIVPDRPGQLIVDLATTQGDPLIVRQRIGNGWSASLLSAPQTGVQVANLNKQNTELWNAMATWPSFVPLIQQLMLTVLDTSPHEANVLAGQSLDGDIPGAVDAAIVSVKLPSGVVEQIATGGVTTSGVIPWHYYETLYSGIYVATGPAGLNQPYAVNVDSVQSSLVSLNPKSLPKQTTPQPTEFASDVTPAQLVYDKLPVRWLLGLLTALLAGESLLAWKLGRRL
ncbi:MAG: VWA domain-containing protein [Planctomycetales bacterium]|nr:VWA domain-containing protein [Planctomycetales bacterium]